jgi:hypothetical protein
MLSREEMAMKFFDRLHQWLSFADNISDKAEDPTKVQEQAILDECGIDSSYLWVVLHSFCSGRLNLQRSQSLQRSFLGFS